MSIKNGGYKICIVCGNRYYSKLYRLAKSKWCSKTCWGKRNPPVEKECLNCRNKFLSYKRDKKVYCSRKCQGIHYKTRLKGKNAPRWQGGKTELNKNIRTRGEFKEWREAVFTRDNWTCRRCGARCQKGLRIDIHPHHIKPLARYPELAYKIDNGITLCSDCHWELHKTERVRDYKKKRPCAVILQRATDAFPDIDIKQINLKTTRRL